MLLKINMLSLLLVMFSLTAQAQEIRNLWKQMPDSVVPVVDKVRRLEMLDLVDYKVKAEVNNRLNSQSVMDTITQSYLHVMLTKQSEVSMRLLSTSKGDTLVCVVYTYKAPKPESTISFYTTTWKQLDANHYLPFSSITSAADSMYLKPDTMSAERYTELRHGVAVELVSAVQHIDDNDIVLSLSQPMTSKDDLVSLAAMTKQRKLVWTGEKYAFSAFFGD